MEHLDGLNKPQKEAVLTTNGPLLIVAGAGAGKTRTLTHRIIHLVKEGVEPHKILAITFTNKAAKEMSARIKNLLGKERGMEDSYGAKELPFMSTFHALGVYMLRNHGGEVGVGKHFSILDKNDSLALIKDSIKTLNIDPKQFEPGRIQSVISKQKGDFITLDEYAASVGNDFFPEIVSKIWTQYEKLLEKNKSLDFDDLLLKTVILLKKSDAVRTYYQNRWQYIHIDEYQDTNAVQYELSRMLAERHGNICVVGDADQNIYSWRGADIKNMLNFEKDYPGAKVILLEENYRSTQTILSAANTVIAKNKVRKEKNLFTKNKAGEPITVYEAYDEADEARFVSGTIQKLLDNGVAPRDIAILYRANFQSRAQEEALLNRNIPYQVLGVRFFDRKEIKDIVSFIKAGLNPDSLADVKRVVNMPPRGIGKITLLKMFAGKDGSLPPTMRKRVDNFRSLLKNIGKNAVTLHLPELIKFVLQKTGMEEKLRSGTEEDKERLENIRELVTFSVKYQNLTPEEGIESFLSDVALATDQDELEKDSNTVKLMTVHAAKGLEFKRVFITGLEQDLFPHKSFGTTTLDRGREEEERRLFYVALTRAEEKLYLSHAALRTIFGSKQVNIPSEFFEDIDDTLIEKEEGTGSETDLLPSIYV